MFAKLSALVLALPLVSALNIYPLGDGATSGQSVTIQWAATTQDPSYFSLELMAPLFNKEYAIADNVQTSLGQITLTLPQVLPGSDYQLVAILPSDVNQVLSTSSTFSIGVGTSSSSSGTSTPSSTSSTTSGTLSTPTSTPTATTSTPVPTVPSASPTTSTAASSTPSSFNSSGAAALKMPGMVPAAAVLLSVVAGAAIVF